MTDTAVKQRDEAIAVAIAEALTAGRSVRAVQKRFGLTAAEPDAVLERLWPIDTQSRVRMIKGDLGKLDRLAEVFYEKALAGDVHSGAVTVKIWERKHELLGLNAVQRIDLQITQPPTAPQSFDKIREVVRRLAAGGNGQLSAKSLIYQY
jgi:hypothetical protein